MITVTTPTPPQAVRDPAAVIAGPLCIDTHVHVYPAFDETVFLDAAMSNAKKLGRGLGVIMLTECRDDHVFARWRDVGGFGPWTFATNGEPETLIASRDGEVALIIIAGRQVITAERLEVLALGTDASFKDGEKIDQTIAVVRGQDALPVIPYGFGKWTGERGHTLSGLIETHAKQGLVLGDNGGRPTIGPRPPHFDQAAAHRLTLLPGTDPLPLRTCQRQACRFGVILPGPFDRATLAHDIKAQLATLGPVPRRFGDHISLPRALYQQIALRLDRKLLGGRGKL